MTIGGIDNLQPLPIPPLPSTGAHEAGSPFHGLLWEALQESVELQHSAQSAAEKHLAGEDVTQVEVFTAVKKAELALKMLLAIRNRTLQAYNEIKEMRI